MKESHIIEAISDGHLGSENGTELSLSDKNDELRWLEKHTEEFIDAGEDTF